MKIEGRKTLVTGAGGFIGSHLVEALVRIGAEVRVFVHYNSRGELGLLERLPGEIKEEIEVFAGDLKDPEALRLPVKGCEIVFHLGSLIAIPYSYINPMDFVQTNILGTANFLNACLASDVEKIVHTSTSEVYGTAVYCPMDEKHPLQAQSPYSATKIAADKLAESYYRSFGVPVAIARPFNTYGPRSHHEGDAGEMIPKSIVRALNGQPVIVFGDGSQTRDFTYVEDTAKGLLAAVECDAMIGKTLNIGCNFEISIKDLAYKITEMVSNPESKVVFTPQRPGDVLRLFADPKRFIELCSWQPQVSFDEGLTKTIDFFRNHPAGIKNLMESESGRNWEEVYDGKKRGH